MLRAEPATLSSWLREAERNLSDAGIASPRHDAERLAARALDGPWGGIWTRLREPVDPELRAELDSLLARRCSGEPLAYIDGSTVFCGIELDCGPGVLVPRPETETLVDVALELIAGRPGAILVDIGTGTGAIALAVAAARPDARVWATDASEDALRYAARNADRTGVAMSIVHGDLFDALPGSLHGHVDLVVSNPPYVPTATPLPPDVAAEPFIALRAGPRGDDVLRRIVSEAPAWLSPGGALALEVGTEVQAGEIADALRSAFPAVGIRDDHNGCPRVVWATR
jgi:release factor glutamine methyltransferase